MGTILLSVFCLLSVGADAASPVSAFFHLNDGVHSSDDGWQDLAAPASNHLAAMSACEEEENEDDGDPPLSRCNGQIDGPGGFAIFGGRRCVTLVPHAKRYLLYCSLKIAC